MQQKKIENTPKHQTKTPETMTPTVHVVNDQ